MLSYICRPTSLQSGTEERGRFKGCFLKQSSVLVEGGFSAVDVVQHQQGFSPKRLN